MRASADAWLAAFGLVSLACATGGCSREPARAAPAEAARTVAAAARAAADASLPPPAYESALPESVRAKRFEKFTGDFDQMVARRLVRVGTTFNRQLKGANRDRRPVLTQAPA